MKFFNIGLIFLLFSTLAIYYYLDDIIFIIQNIFDKIILIKINNYIIFILSLIIINFVLFLTPIPTFLLIVFNGYVLNSLGFFLSFLTIILCSMIIFNTVKKNNFIFEFKYFKNIKEKINKNKNNDINFFIVASSRYVLPYFIHNIFFGAILKNYKIFLFAIFLAEIPTIFILNKVGIQLNNLKELSQLNLVNILKFENFIILMLIFLFLFISNRASKYIKNKIK